MMHQLNKLAITEINHRVEDVLNPAFIKQYVQYPIIAAAFIVANPGRATQNSTKAKNVRLLPMDDRAVVIRFPRKLDSSYG